MSCSHGGFRNISSNYDRDQRVLVFYWTCERCGERIGEAGRTTYQPRFEPNGNSAYLDAQR